MNRRVLLTVVILGMFSCSATAAVKSRFRRPVAIAVSPDCKLLYTANRRSGSVSEIDVAKRSVVREIDVAGRLSGMAMLAGGKHILVTDEKNHQLILLSGGRSDWKITARLKVAAYPVGVVAGRDGTRCYVSSLWSKSVTVIDLSLIGKPRMRVVKTIRIPFPPRRICLARNETRLIVAGAFDGAIGVIDTKRNTVVAVKRIPGHNIRGLAVSANGKRLLTTQQSLNPLARSTFDDVHWGNMLVNVLYSLSLDDVCDPKVDPLRDRRETHLGAPENAAGDPGAIAVAAGRVAIALSGVHEIAVSRGLKNPLSRISVGRRPTALTMSQDGKRVFVADTYSDSVSIIDAEQAKRIAQISLGPQPKLKPADHGEQLFSTLGFLTRAG